MTKTSIRESGPYGLRLSRNAAGGLKPGSLGARKELAQRIIPGWNKGYSGRMNMSTGQLSQLGGSCQFTGGCTSMHCRRCRYHYITCSCSVCWKVA